MKCDLFNWIIYFYTFCYVIYNVFYFIFVVFLNSFFWGGFWQVLCQRLYICACEGGTLSVRVPASIPSATTSYYIGPRLMTTYQSSRPLLKHKVLNTYISRDLKSHVYGCPVYMMDSALTWWILLSCLIKQVHLELHLSKQGKTRELVRFYFS